MIIVIIKIVKIIVLFFGFLYLTLLFFWFYFFISREECQPMHVKFISLLKGELTVKLERFNLEF